MEWIVIVDGDSNDLQWLADNLKTPELSFERKDDTWVLKSSYIIPQLGYDSVRNKATELLQAINVDMMLKDRLSKHIVVNDVIKVSDDGKKTFVKNISCTVVISDRCEAVVTRNGVVVEDNRPKINADFVKLSQKDSNVQKVFRLMASELDWVNLYRIYEVIESDIGGLKILADKGWASESKLKLFKHTANHPGATGDIARHGALNSQPPQVPMSIQEARNLVKNLVSNWLQSK